MAQEKLPDFLREFDDAKAARRNIYSNTLEAMRKRFPVEDENYRLDLLDVDYDGPQEFSLSEQKKALLNNRNLRTNLVGKWRLTDKRTGQVLDEKRQSIMQVPYWTDRGTFINNGSEYTVISQSRLRPGVYARRKSNGEYEAQFNIKPGTGRAFHFGLNPETGVMTLQTGQGSVPLYQILKGMGVDDKEIVKYWGADVAAANSQKADPQAWNKLYRRMAGYKAIPNATEADKIQFVKDAVSGYEVDPEVIERTMGLRNVSNVTPQLMLRASQKLLNISRGDEKPDNRDNPRFSKFYGVEDYFKERVEKNAGRLANTLLYKARRNGNLKSIQPNALNPWVDTIINGSGLAMPGEEANPLSTLEQMSRISKFGLGGIGSKDAVTMEARDVQGDYLGFVDSNSGPESESVGVDVRAAYHTYLGKDNKLYGEFIDNQTGKKAYVDIATAADRMVAFPGQDMNQPYVMAMKDGIPQRVPTSEVRYMVPSYGHMITSNTNMNPMPTGVQSTRQFYGSKFWSQYLPQAKGEVPLVDSLMPDGRTTWSEYYGRKVGTLKSEVDGVVTKVDDNMVTVKGDDGKVYKTELVKNLPFNRLSQVSFFPAVEAGQSVKAGDMLAHSNYTDKRTGAMNMGQNLHVAVIPNGFSFEDGHVISEGAARRLTTDCLYSFDHETRNGVTIGKNKFISAYPSKFTKEQVETLDENGVAKPGTVLHRGDPLILSLGPKILSSSDKALGKLSKALRNSYTDRSETWEHDYEGRVVDTAVTPKGVKVNVSAQPPVREGDKLSGRFGLKGVVAQILPDDKMPRDAVTNQPYDMLVNPMGFLSRVAPGQLMEISLGKIAKKTGKPYRIPQLPPPEGWYRWTQAEMAKNGVPEATDIFDPASGRTIKGVGDGYMYVQAFHHLAEKKMSAVGADGSYTQDEQPAKGGVTGSKKVSGMDLWQMLAHNVPDVIKDSHLIRGTRNDQYWRALQLGLPTPEPEEPFIYKKFLNTLRAGGINITEKGNITKIMPQTDRDIDQLAQGRVITSAEMVDSDFEPVKGGLFDLGKTGGMAGSQWSMIQLPEPVPNPIMEEPVRRLLGLTAEKMENILAGRDKLDGKTGGQALKDALAKVDVDKRIVEARRGITTLRGQKRDDAVKVYRYLTAMKEQGLKPQDWMVSKVPVLPPTFRPVSKMGDVALVSDMNELYKDIIENAKNFEELRKDVDDSALADERLDIYNSVKAAYGLGNPITPENAAKGVKGAIRQVIGSRPKFGQYQSKVLSKAVGGVARGVTVADPNYDMDTLGMPENMAWPAYKPYVMRALVQHGYPAVTAIKMIADRTPTARHLLEEEMAKRPVIMDRAPTWHKFNFMAFFPKLIEGDRIVVSPLVDPSFNMDHDGNCVDFDSLINVRLPKSMLDKMDEICDNGVSLKNKEYSMTNKNTSIRILDNDVEMTVKIGTFPRVGAPSLDRNGAYIYSVPEGIKVLSVDPSTGARTYQPVSRFTQEFDCDTVEVFYGSKSVIVSGNESLAVFDPKEGRLVRVAPSKDEKRMTPVLVSSSENFGTFGDRDLGWLFGAYISDGWSDHRMVGYTKLEKVKRDEFVRILRANHQNFNLYEYEGEKGSSKLGKSAKIHCNSRSVAEWLHQWKFVYDEAREAEGGRTALYKMIDQKLIEGGSEEFLWGLLSGLLDGDGSVVCNMAKAKPRYTFRLNTSSPYLRDDLCRLCHKLGLRYSTTVVKARGWSKESYVVSPSTVDMFRNIGKLTCVGESETSIIAAFASSKNAPSDNADMIPISDREFGVLKDTAEFKKHGSLYNTVMRTRKEGSTRAGRGSLLAIIDELRGNMDTADLITRVFTENTKWVQITDVVPRGKREVFDLEVATTKTFVVNDGVTVWDTVNLHVPSTMKAVNQALERMLPSENLTSLTDLSTPRYQPSKEQIFGLYALTKGMDAKPVKVFNTVSEAKQAYARGEIGPNDPIQILGR